MVQTMTMTHDVIILTRPELQNHAFEAELRAAGVRAKVIHAPVTRIVPEPQAPDLTGIEGVIFTSRNAVEHAPSLTLLAWCVGDKTARAARARGWVARSAAGDVEALLQRICADPPNGRLCHLAGLETRGALAERLTEAGIPTSRQIVYHQEEVALNDAALSAISESISAVFPVFSPRSAERLVAQLPKEVQVDFVALSDAVAQKIPRQIVRNLRIAPRPTAQSVILTLKGEKAAG